jgi:hypothetical protein
MYFSSPSSPMILFQLPSRNDESASLLSTDCLYWQKMELVDICNVHMIYAYNFWLNSRPNDDLYTYQMTILV